MEPTEEVLVVIQAESGEEIAVPLAALDEQHQEVVLDSEETSNTIELPTCDQNASKNSIVDDCKSNTTLDTSSSLPVEKPIIIRQKQKRKEKLVCLPLFDNEKRLEFQMADNQTSPARDEPKRRPRKEYRSKRKSAVLGRSDKKQPDDQSKHMDPDLDRESSDIEETINSDQQDTLETNENRDQRDKQVSEHPKTFVEDDAPSVVCKQEEQSPVQLPQRRTRLSNSCRVATGKMYKCNDCDFSTERINNIIIHMKETCPKVKKER